MADIRQSAAYLDQFNRADEDPLSFGGKWGIVDTTPWTQMVLKGGNATHKSGSAASMSIWLPASWDNDDAEAWGQQSGGGANGIAWAIALIVASSAGGASQADGYRFRLEISSTTAIWRIYRIDNAGLVTLHTSASTPDAAYRNGAGFMLIRRNGNDVEGWISLDTITWTRVCQATDTTYMTDLSPAIGITDNAGTQILGWEAVGGGVDRTIAPLPLYIRRTHRRGAAAWRP